MTKKKPPSKAKRRAAQKKPRAATTAPTPPAPPAADPDRAVAAAEVLEAVFLGEKNFDLESQVVQKDGQPVVDQDADECLWVTVRIHVPRLDVDTWLDGTHLDHPNNQDDDGDDA